MGFIPWEVTAAIAAAATAVQLKCTSENPSPECIVKTSVSLKKTIIWSEHFVHDIIYNSVADYNSVSEKCVGS